MISFIAETVIGNKKKFYIVAEQNTDGKWVLCDELHSIPDGVYKIPSRVFHRPVVGETAVGDDVTGFIENGSQHHFLYDSSDRTMRFIAKSEVDSFISF